MLLGATDIPQVFVSGISQQPEVASVLADAKTGMLAAAEHLWQLGHEKVTVLEIQSMPRPYCLYEGHQRGSDWVAVLAQCRLLSDLIGVPQQFESGDAVAQIIDRLAATHTGMPSALICHNDALAARVLSHLQTIHCAVPDDVSVVGYDDSIRVRDILPHLTTIHHPRRLGQEAVRLIFEYREYGTPVAGKTVRLPTSLVVRASTAVARKKEQEESRPKE